MGYLEEKQEYKEQLEEKDIRKEFCNVCGRPVTPKNIKGKCVECEEIICNSCGTIYNGKVTCVECKLSLKIDLIEQQENSKKNTGFDLSQTKKWWLLPIIIMLLLVVVLIVLGQSSAIFPFIYALF